MKNCWKFWQRSRARSRLTPSPSRLHLIKGGLILEWLPKKCSAYAAAVHIRTENTRTPAALSRNPPRGQIALRGARGRPTRIRVSRRLTDANTCSTSDYPAMTLAVFHSLSISTRLNLHLAKSAGRPSRRTTTGSWVVNPPQTRLFSRRERITDREMDSLVKGTAHFFRVFHCCALARIEVASDVVVGTFQLTRDHFVTQLRN